MRIVLDENAKRAAEEMMTALRSAEQCIDIQYSKLISWVTKRYRETAFDRDCEAIIRAHFDSKEYLKNVIKKSGTGDLAQALQTALARVRQSEPDKRKRRELVNSRQTEPAPSHQKLNEENTK